MFFTSNIPGFYFVMIIEKGWLKQENMFYKLSYQTVSAKLVNKGYGKNMLVKLIDNFINHQYVKSNCISTNSLDFDS